MATMAKCQLCGKKHQEITCRERKGCSKCGEFTKHKAEDCPTHESYPKYESRNKLLDQFTPLSRQKYLENPTTTASAPTEAGPSSRANKTPGKTLIDSAAPGSQVDEITIEERERLWKEAETRLPRKPLKAKDEIDTSGASDAKGNFFKIEVSSSVKLYKYSVTLGELWPKKPTKTPSRPSSSKGQSNSPGSGKSKEHDETNFNGDGSNDGDLSEEENGTYERKIKPETKRYMIDQIMANVQNKSVIWATDYDATIISVGPVSKHPIDKGKLDIEISHTRSSGKVGVGPIAVLSKLTFLGIVDTAGLNAHVNAKSPKFMVNPENDLKALNIISWKNINDTSFNGGRVDKKFYPSSLAPYDPPESEEAKVWKNCYVIRHGFFSSMRPGESSILLNVNTVTTTFYSDVTLQAWITKCWGDFQPQNSEFRKKLKNVRVELLLHEEGRRRPFQICAISTDLIASQTYEKEDKKFEKVAVYLKRKYPSYNKRYNGESYCINVGVPKYPVWYPATELKIVKWQVATKDIPEHLNTCLISAASKKPWQNQDEILNNGLQCLGISPVQPFYSSFGLKPMGKFVELKAAKLIAPQVNDKTSTPISIWNGGWDFERPPGRQFSESNPFGVLFVISFTKLGEGLKSGLSAICQQLGSRGAASRSVYYETIEISVPSTSDDREWAVFRTGCTSSLNTALGTLNKKAKPGEVEGLLVVLPPKALTSLYSEIKRWSDCIAGIATTCITMEKLLVGAGDTKLCDNVCQKINFKLKGWSHTIKSASTGKGYAGAKQGTMVVGADVTHPQKGSGCPSMAAVVATSDESSNQYLGSGRLQKGKDEYIHDLRGMMRERVITWVETNKSKATSDRLPKAILFYRDGVSESQFGMVRHEELSQIREGCSDAEALLRKGKKALITKSVPKWVPKITLIVVIKRHHARFYPAGWVSEEGRTDKKTVHNLPCGTVADTVVVTPNHWSFYLQSHYSGLGTARSALYVVLEDTADYKPRDLQMVTNNLCYTGSRAMKIISACAPARYADLLCERLRCYLRPFIDKRYQPGHLKMDEVDNVEVEKPYTNFVADPHIWMSPNSTRQNPWHPNMDDVMFYL